VERLGVGAGPLVLALKGWTPEDARESGFTYPGLSVRFLSVMIDDEGDRGKGIALATGTEGSPNGSMSNGDVGVCARDDGRLYVGVIGV